MDFFFHLNFFFLFFFFFFIPKPFQPSFYTPNVPWIIDRTVSFHADCCCSLISFSNLLYNIYVLYDLYESTGTRRSTTPVGTTCARRRIIVVALYITILLSNATILIVFIIIRYVKWCRFFYIARLYAINRLKIIDYLFELNRAILMEWLSEIQYFNSR